MKRKSLKKSILILCFLTFWIILSMVWANESLAAAKEKIRLSMGGALTGSAMYMFSAAMANEWNQLIPEVDITVVATAGSNAHYIPLDKGELDLATGSNLANYWVTHGIQLTKTKLNSICVMFPISTNYCHTMTFADSPMKTFKDQDGKNVLIGPRGSAGATLAVEKFQALGIKPKVMYTTQIEAIDMMKDRRADSITYHSPLRWSGWLDIATARPVKLIPMTSEDQKKIADACPYSFPDVIRAKTYDFQNEDINTMSDFACVIARPGIPEDIVYKLTKLMWDKRGELMKSIESLKWINPEMVLSLNAPLHPGAAKYYREIGVKIPDQMIWKKE